MKVLITGGGGFVGRYLAAHSAEQVDKVREEVRSLLTLSGNERVVDVGTGAGTLAFALAPRVREVVGVDAVPELLAAARAVAPANVTFIEADATSLPLESFSFDLAVTRRTLHHIARPELVVAELVRVTRLGGTIVIEDQIAPVDPLAALSHVGDSWNDRSTVYRVNVEGTAHVLDAARAAGVRRVVVVGSAEEYGRVDAADLPLREDAQIGRAHV